MSDTAVTTEAAMPEERTSSHLGRAARFAARFPFTVGVMLAILLVAITTGTLLSPASEASWYGEVGTGLPAFADGRWWTIFISPFFLNRPVTLLLLIPLVLGGVGWAEYRFGTLRTIVIFVAGHLVGVFGAAGIIAILAPSGWHWAEQLSTRFDVGPSCGAFACLTFALATLPSPWRLRTRYALGIWASIEILYIGHLSNVEHAVTIAVALIVSGVLPAFRHRAGRPSTREWRLLAFGGIITIGVIQVIDLAVPYDGPLGLNQPVFSLIDVAVDILIIALVANGIRQGLRIAWVVTIILAAFNILPAILGATLISLFSDLGVIEKPLETLGLLLAPGLLWFAVLVILILGRGAFHVRLRRARRALTVDGISRDEALEKLRTLGGGTISWMTGWAPNRYLPAGEGYVAFQNHAGVAIGLGDPVTAPGEAGAALEKFARVAEEAGFIPCVFSSSPVATAARPKGWRAVVIAEDTIVDLEDFTLTGKRWQPVRTSVNRAERENISFRMCTLADEPWNVRAQVRAISEQWSGDKGLPEMRFTLGTVEEALDPETRVGIAVDSGGNLHGVTSWLPVYGGDGKVTGWTLDLMRRRDDGFGPVMEFLIASSALHFADEGYSFLSLSGAPLVRPAELEAGAVDNVLDRLGEMIEPLYGFKSLHRFKQKFNPRAESLSLLYRDEGDLPRIAVALTKAYLPDATLRDLASSVTNAG